MENKFSEEFLQRRDKVAKQMKIAWFVSLAAFGFGLLLVIIGYSLDHLVTKTFGWILVGFGGLSILLFSMFCLQIRFASQTEQSETLKSQSAENKPELLNKPKLPEILPVHVPVSDKKLRLSETERIQSLIPENLEKAALVYERMETKPPQKDFKPPQKPENEGSKRQAAPVDLDENTKQRIAALDELLKEKIILPEEYEKMLKNILES